MAKRYILRSIAYPDMAWAISPTLKAAKKEFSKHSRQNKYRVSVATGPAALLAQISIDDCLTLYWPKGLAVTHQS